jgi:TonB family protein
MQIKMATIFLNRLLIILSILFRLKLANAQTDWSIEDLHVTTFRNGDPLMEVNSDSNWKFCNDNQIPAYYKLGKSLEDGVLYNFYAIKDERQLAPVGYRIPEVDDLMALASDQFFQSTSGGWKTSTGNGYFNADANGYLPFEGETMEVLSKGDAAYYWTMTDGKALHSMGFVILNGEKGYSLQQMRRENFCAVRCIKNEEEELEELIYTFTEEEAEFPGGYPAMMQFIQKNWVYPPEALDMGVEGIVYVKFVVTSEGTISSVQVERGLAGCPECDEEAIRVVKLMKGWKPGKFNGINVSSVFRLPLGLKAL